MGLTTILRNYSPRTLSGDKLFSYVKYIRNHKRFPIKNSGRINDYLFFIKTSGILYDPIIQYVTDKEFAKVYFENVLGKDYVIETINVIRSKAEIDEFMPSRYPCVIKPTHLSGQIIICQDPYTPIDRSIMHGWFDQNHYYKRREQNYRFLRPKIICERLFSEEGGGTIPKDYKFFCINGNIRFISVISGRSTSNMKINYYGLTWKKLNITHKNYPSSQENDSKPILLDDMVHVAKKLSSKFSHVRVDMFSNSNEIKMVELTFCQDSANSVYLPANAEYLLMSPDSGLGY